MVEGFQKSVDLTDEKAERLVLPEWDVRVWIGTLKTMNLGLNLTTADKEYHQPDLSSDADNPPVEYNRILYRPMNSKPWPQHSYHQRGVEGRTGGSPPLIGVLQSRVS